jgi:hypothetical protein
METISQIDMEVKALSGAATNIEPCCPIVRLLSIQTGVHMMERLVMR